jgi:hypothetical protein
MATPRSSIYNGLFWNKDCSRMDFFYRGTRSGHFDANGVTSIGVLSVASVIAAAGACTNIDIELQTKGTGGLLLTLGGTESFRFSDVEAQTFAAEDETAGHPNFWQPEDGGASVGCAAAGAGGLLTITGGQGGVGHETCNRAGGAGGALSVIGGLGGATVACSSGAAGAGGAVVITSGGGGANPACSSGAAGAGGAITVTAGDAGDIAGTGAPAVGGAISITAGEGSDTAVACDTAGAGGGLTLKAGPGGDGTAACGCTGGAGGNLTLQTGGAGTGASCGAIGKLRLLCEAGTGLFSAAAACEPFANLGTVWAWTGDCAAVAKSGSAFLMIVDDGCV